MKTFEQLIIGELFTIGAENPDGTKCVKLSSESSAKGYGQYVYHNFRSDCPPFLITHDCPVTVVQFTKSRLPQWPSVTVMIHLEATEREESCLAALAKAVLLAYEHGLITPGENTLAETALADYQSRYK